MNKPPWFGEYELLHIPETLEPYPDWPVHCLLEAAAEQHPRSGVWQLGREWSYHQVLDHALLPDFYLDSALLCFHHRHDLAALY